MKWSSGLENVRAGEARQPFPAMLKLLSIAAVVFIFCWRDVRSFWEHGTNILIFDDDFYYYYMVARRLVETGISSFDGQVATNGYHPLWLIMLTGAVAAFGDNLLAIRAFEIGLLLATLWFFLQLLEVRSISVAIVCFGAFFWAVRAASLNGMETAPLFLFWTMLVYTLARIPPGTGGKRTALLWLLASACIGARLDAAVFVLPLILFATTGRERMIVLGGIAALGLLYAAINQILFGLPFPISGSVKSLGGGGLNETLVADLLARGLNPKRILLGNLFTLGLLVLAAPIFIAFAPRRGIERPLIYAFLCGTTLFSMKLFFGSSWIVWPWYSFPLYFGMLAYLLVLRHQFPRLAESRVRRVVPALLATAMALFLGYYVLAVRPSEGKYFAVVSRNALDQFRPILQGAAVAMGDRAGSFAYLYDGQVTQLEGLVNDREYLRVLKEGGDVRALLCQRGVHFVASYEAALGDYLDFEVPTIRRDLSGFAAPGIPVARQDQLAAFFGPGIEDKKDTFYLWRLACARGTAAPAPPPGQSTMR